MNRLGRTTSTVRWLIVVSCIAVPWAGHAYQLSDDVEFRAVYRGENYFRTTDTDHTFFDLRRNQFVTENRRR